MIFTNKFFIAVVLAIVAIFGMYKLPSNEAVDIVKNIVTVIATIGGFAIGNVSKK